MANTSAIWQQAAHTIYQLSEFSSPGSTLCADPYFGIRSAPVLPQCHVNDPGHSAESAGYSSTHMHPMYLASNKVILQTGAWLYGVHRPCAEKAAVSRGTSHANQTAR